MRRTILQATAALALAAALPLTAATNPARAQDTQPAYLVASLKVDDLNAYFQQYGGPVFPQLQAAGAEVLVGAPSVDVLEGDYGATWTAVVRFPSMDALQGWYGSDEYQAIAPARRERTVGAPSFMIAAPAFAGPPAQ